jgi:beta-galactosidase
MKKLLIYFFLLIAYTGASAQRSVSSLNLDWAFHLGDAASMQGDFTHGTEYFTYRAKAVGQNKGPASVEFDDKDWTRVNLPHDWVVDLPYHGKASHSHGYKQVGWQYPQNSIGWYRRHFTVDKEDEGKAVSIRFDGIFRNAQVFCNGFYLGTEPSGYASQEYNVSEYLNYGGDNIIAVRCDATTEEGWFYEGAGIYRDTWLIKKDARHKIDNVFYTWKDGKLTVKVEATCDYRNTLFDHQGNIVAQGKEALSISQPHLWSITDPYLYTLKTETSGGEDAVCTKVGLRTLTFDAKEGVLLNGQPFKFKGVDLHLDHAGVGVAVSKALWIYRINKLREIGVNAIRWSHNPASDVALDVCDSLGILCIDENRLMGTNQEHFDLLRRMIVDHRNHPSVALWSIGNEEWWIEGNDKGEKIARTMIDYARTIDDSRLYTYGCSGGFGIVKQVDIHGYNYIIQNDVDNRHKAYPDWVVVGTEETSGCGTRNVYQTDSIKGWMKSINMAGEERSKWEKNVIERGWKFYRDNIWAGGVFWWTGIDYRGEPNPMVWPATGSQFGILDYCCFPKDEAYYLKAAWTDQPVLHIFPHWNLKGQEGQQVEVWAYTNMDEVELVQDGKSLGRQKADKDSHLVWNTTYRPGRLVAYGYKNGKRVITERVETTGPAEKMTIDTSKSTLQPDGQDIVVVDITLKDKKGRYVPDACNPLQVSVSGPAEILGWGNGDPGFKTDERPQGNDRRHATLKAFMGNAQVIVRGVNGEANTPVIVTVNLDNGSMASATFQPNN